MSAPNMVAIRLRPGAGIWALSPALSASKGRVEVEDAYSIPPLISESFFGQEEYIYREVLSGEIPSEV